jgi:formate-dependent nitrite reductase membrane component NrfD
MLHFLFRAVTTLQHVAIDLFLAGMAIAAVALAIQERRKPFKAFGYLAFAAVVGGLALLRFPGW